jgi:transcriptional regulator with XRE-family HTH domain
MDDRVEDMGPKKNKRPKLDPVKLERARLRAGMKQVQLARAAGIRSDYISSMECGRRGASARTRRKIADVLGIDVREIETGGPPPQAGELSRLEAEIIDACRQLGEARTREIRAYALGLLSSGSSDGAGAAGNLDAGLPPDPPEDEQDQDQREDEE